MSYVTVPPAYAMEIADFYINTRNLRIRREEEAMIEAEMHRRWLRPRDRKEARERLKSSDGMHDWHSIRVRGSLGYTQALELKHLARAALVCGEKVALSERHAWLVDWKPREQKCPV